MRLSGLCSGLVILALDAFQNMLALAMALRVLHVRIRPFPVCFAALTGAFAAFAASIARVSRAWEMLFWLPVALLMMRIAAGRIGERRRSWGYAAALLACEGFLGGVVLALYGATGSLAVSHGLSMVCAGAVFVIAWRTREAEEDIRRIRIICTVGERMLSFDAMVDSGNTLRDYLTHRPVIVAGTAIYKHLEDGVRTRLIFADTAGGRQMMRLVIPGNTTIVLGGRQRHVEAALAFSSALPADAPALAPSSLLR